MKKLFLLTIASWMTIFAMVAGNGSTKADAIDFDWDKGVEHSGGTKWYRVDLAPLYEEDNPSLTLYLTNPSNVVGTSVDVSMKATVAGQTESKDYTIAAHQYKTYTANASMLVSMRQTEIYLTLSSTGKIKLSAKVFETADLDETCKDARVLSWDKETVQNPMYSAWWKVSLKPIKDNPGYDAQVTLTNTGSKTLNLKVGQSLDCPSSGTTRREYTLAPGESVVKKIPADMITSVQPDELYFGIENVESQVTFKVEKVAQPPVPIIPDAADMPGVNLHVTDTILPLPTGTTLYKISVADMDSLNKYEPEFTYRNVGSTPAKVTVQMAFSRPAFSTSDTEYDLAVGGEEIVVYKKNMLEGMAGVDSIYLYTTVVGDVNFYGRFKHVREGKACKTNIDFNWVSGHSQEGRTTQWYAIDVAPARERLKDIIIYVQNMGDASATVKASMAFSCPYIDLQEATRTIGAKSAPVSRRMGFSSYAMMSDTVWVGLETSQPIKFWADTVDAETKEEVDTLCLHAKDFNWEEGVSQNGGDTVWYKIDMTQVRDLTAKFPTVFVQNLSSTKAAKIDAELSVECPDSIENEKHSLTIAANGSYSKPITRTMFENIVSEEIYLRVVSSQDISLQIRLTEEKEGASCASAIPFNWQSGNIQEADVNQWYSIDLRKIMRTSNDLKLHIENRDNTAGKGVAQLSFACPVVDIPTVQNFSLAAKATRSVTIQNSALETVVDSVVYVNLEANVGLRIWADTIIPAPFDTITAEDITLIPLQWDSLYTQTVDTAWYIIPKSEIDLIRNSDEKVKPVAHLINLSNKPSTIVAEAAFALPIVKNMMKKNQELKAKQHITDTLQASTFDQFLKKDSIIIRITRKPGSCDFQFRAELVGAYNGNSRLDALKFRLGETYVQEAMTEMWYRINTKDLKEDKNIGSNDRLLIRTSNLGNDKDSLTVYIYEGLTSEVDMLEQFGMGDYRSRVIKKGEDRERTFPAEYLKAIGDVDLFIKIRTDQKIVFKTEVSGEYPAVAVIDSAQWQDATFLAPNATYVVPGDNQTHWYQICLPYIRNNYKYTHDCSLTYELNGTATIESCNTFQDTMRYQMPVRKRTINKEGGPHKGTQPLSELLNKAIERFADQSFDISSFEQNFVDSMLHRYITADSVTLYLRLKTDKDLKVCLNMKRVKGQTCDTAMVFDWEHGNVNKAKDTMWVHLNMDSTYVPKGKHLKLHMNNLSKDSTWVKAYIYKQDCEGEELASVSRKILNDTTKIFNRQLLVDWGWSGMRIKYYSDSATHVWAEVVDTIEQVYDSIYIPAKYVCPNTIFYDTINDPHLIDPDDDSTWHFIVEKEETIKEEAKVITHRYFYDVYPKALPTLPAINSLTNIPVVTKGTPLDCSYATAELYMKLNSATMPQRDSIMLVKDGSITWEYCVDGENWLPIPATALDTAAIALRYSLTTECDNDTTSNYWVNIPTYDIYVTACDSYTWDLTGESVNYTTSQQVMSAPIPVNAMIDKYIRLNLTVNYSGTGEESLTICESQLPFAWKDKTCTAAGDYTFDTLTALGCDSTITLHLTVNKPDSSEVSLTICPSQLPYAWKDKTCTAAGDYTFDTLTTLGCDSVITLHLTVNEPDSSDVYETICSSALPFDWKGKSYTAAGDYTFDTLTVAGCDSVITLHLTVNEPATGDTTAVECVSFDWYGTTYTTSGDYTTTIIGGAGNGCDSIVTLHLTINNPTYGDTTAVECDEFEWYGTKYTTTGKYTHTLEKANIYGCDSIVTLDLTINNSVATKDTVTSCNSYFWELDSVTYYETGVYKAKGKTVNGCDSTVTLTLTINNPVVFDLKALAKYGNRLLMINRLAINESTGWALDSLGATGEAPEVIWWRKNAVTDEDSTATQEGTGYYITNKTNPGQPLVGVYFATIDLPQVGSCGHKGRTENLICGVSANAAPALMPSLARPGENIRVVNLDPEEETVIRIYTTEGLLHNTYTVSGEETFEMKAAEDHGFYLVEVSNSNIQTTLRYIVK